MTFTPDQVALLDANRDHVEAIRLFELEFASASYRLAESTAPVVAGGHTWQPVGDWIEAAPVTSSDPLKVRQAEYVVGSFTDTLIHDAFHNRAEWYQADVRQYMLLRLDGVSVGAPVLLHRGRIMDVEPSRSFDQERIVIRAEPLLAERNWTPLGRYTDRDQKARSAGDRGCEYVGQMQDKVITGWLKA
ncbi:hypothetical protein [Palleronia caenipelagi]|uniref:Uncharacterized protein n=1 Tax=Palleronia caenipelagi TaxID=2489174 RepID=A0A547Q695_9RHOB|nr:hypothetical protein [Palleronia caenipelagi]TRD21915.1 hypothetical protein FEV53_07650 [Palleronia caenipelagi]